MKRAPGAYLAIDQGTTTSKAALIDAAGRTLGAARVALATRFGRGGRAEQDPDDILASQRLAIERALRAAGHPTLAAAGIASQRSTFVLWDRRTGRAVAPAPTWQDTSAAALCARWSGHGARVRRITGLPLSPHYSATKLSRLLDARPALRRRARDGDLLFGCTATYLLWHLTGGRTHAIDPTLAARTLLFDIERLTWDPSLLDRFGIPRPILPEIRHSLDDFGDAALGRRGAPVKACLGDQQAALIGTTGLRGGGAPLANYGTGAFLLIPTGARLVRRRGLLSSVLLTSPAGPRYLLEGTVNPAGAAVDWLRKELGAPGGSRAFDRLCRKGSGELLVIASFWGLGSAWPETPAGLIAGPPGAAEPWTLADLARGTVEAIAHMVTHLVTLAKNPGGPPAGITATGGLVSLRYLMQYQAASLGIPVTVAPQADATLRGVALAASRGRIRAAAGARRHALEPQPRLAARARERGAAWRSLLKTSLQRRTRKS